MLRSQCLTRHLMAAVREELLYKSVFSFSTSPPDLKKSPKKSKASIPLKIKKLLKHMVDFVKEGSKKSWEDIKYLHRLKKSKKPIEYSGIEIMESNRIFQDIIKLIPFSILIIVPLMDLLIPPYVLLFPNAMPTAFVTRTQIMQKAAEKQEIQKEAHEYLLKTFLERLSIGTEEPDVLKILWKERKEDIEKILDIRKLDSDTLLALNRFTSNDFIKGTHIISELLKYSLNFPRYIMNIGLYIVGSKKRIYWRHWIFNYEIKLNFFPLEPIKAAMLRFQLGKTLKVMRIEDKSLFKYGISKDDPFDIVMKLARKRGIGQSPDKEITKILLGDWAAKFGNKDMTQTSYVWYAVINYTPD